MKEYETLTREKVDVVPFGCGMPETHLMQDWGDKMLDLILNGPTINGIKKDEVRAMLRETYFDRADWESTCGVLFGDRRDYVDRVDAYHVARWNPRIYFKPKIWRSSWCDWR